MRCAATLQQPRERRGCAAWTLINWLTSPEIAGAWSRSPATQPRESPSATCPRWRASWPSMAADGGAGSAAYARGWFATCDTVGVRKALEDGVEAILSGDRKLLGSRPKR